MRLGAIRITHAALLCAALAAHPVHARAEEPSRAEVEDRIDDDAIAVLDRFGATLKALPRFSFAVDLSYEVVQKDGQKLEFGSSRVYTVRRPDRLRIEELGRDGGRRELFFDGNQLAVYVPGDKAYALANLKQHRDLDATLDLIRDALDIQVPLGELLNADPIARIGENMTSAYIVDRETVSGVECDHVAWRSDEIDAEAWFSTGAEPLIQRLVIHYRILDGQPSFRARFTNWNRSPDVADSVFVFTPSADLERIRFTVRGRDVQSAQEQTP